MMKNSSRLVLALILVIVSGPTGFGQTPATGRVMREKLGHSQKILEAILTSNFALLDRESAALGRATQAPAWVVLKGPEYMKQSEAFLKALRDLSDAAKERDLDAALRLELVGRGDERFDPRPGGLGPGVRPAQSREDGPERQRKTGPRGLKQSRRHLRLCARQLRE